MMHIILLTMLVVSALLAVSLRDILKAGIALGVLSIILSVLFFKFDSPYAAVFELSICAGLITVLFTSVVSLTQDKDGQD
ncbi:MAG: DUF4040 domain-containing protein [Candidatus Saganbacteria bacterium]|nr:DUF4040 domain-containing protein [Candidatus Saganbacteria bacterium]